VLLLSHRYSRYDFENAKQSKTGGCCKTEFEFKRIHICSKISQADLALNMGVMKDVDVGYILAAGGGVIPGGGIPGMGLLLSLLLSWVSYYVVKTGTVVVDMVDLKNAMKEQN
jgi:hypothetical protein